MNEFFSSGSIEIKVTPIFPIVDMPGVSKHQEGDFFCIVTLDVGVTFAIKTRVNLFTVHFSI